MKTILVSLLTLTLTLTLTACSKSENSEHPSKEEMKKRNDTSNHETDIGHNKTY